jgi:hypothetical protein
MPAQTNPSCSWMAPPEGRGQHPGLPQRYPNRAVVALILASGLVFTGSLCSVLDHPPDRLQLIELYPPKHALPDFLPGIANLLPDFDHDLSGVPTDELPGLVESLEFLNPLFGDFLDHALSGVSTHELPSLVELLEFLNHKFPDSSSGGGGLGGSSAGVPTNGLVILLDLLKHKLQEMPDVPTDVLAALVMLLEFLKHKLQEFPDVSTDVLAALVMLL